MTPFAPKKLRCRSWRTPGLGLLDRFENAQSRQGHVRNCLERELISHLIWSLVANRDVTIPLDPYNLYSVEVPGMLSSERRFSASRRESSLVVLSSEESSDRNTE